MIRQWAWLSDIHEMGRRWKKEKRGEEKEEEKKKIFAIKEKLKTFP